ncbi:MAG TPA: 2-C-methyl-D-erythritol 4-phosphate cytidylyltransferase [Thermoleophilaceae bacterium]|nr:2-C-methyl-D-erythritol 4-phosphate cytidylyltransferase [Thermoleophilaceae bacterium]
MSVVGIVPAAGAGERLGADVPKAFAVLGGRPMLEWSLDVLREVCDRVVVAVPPDRAAPPDFVPGGATRSASVRAALDAAPEASVVVVHDAARPLVTAELVRRCIDALEGFDGAIAALPVTDTVKVVDGAEIIRTPDRGRLWAAQTPQVFRAEALRRTSGEGTDDAALVEATGGRVCVVEGIPENFKVTTPLDMRIAEMLLC